MSKKHKIVVHTPNYSVDFSEQKYEELSVDMEDVKQVMNHLQQKIHSFQYNHGPITKGYIIVSETMYKILEYYVNYTEEGRMFGIKMDSFFGFKLIQGDTLQAVIGWE